MATNSKVIITCAVTGAIHTPSMSPYLPVTPDEIAAAAIGAAEAGAAIVHLHARDPETGKPDQSPEAFARFLPRIKQASDAVINLTTGGAPYMTVQERVKPARDVQAGSRLPQHGLDEFRPVSDAATASRRSSTSGSRRRWRTRAISSSATRSRTSNSCWRRSATPARASSSNATTPSHLYNLAHFLERGLVKPPLFVQTVFGILGGIGPHPEDVLHMKRTADRLFGDQYRWSVLGAGRSQLPIAAQAAAMGGNVRVGLEDSLWAGAGQARRLATPSRCAPRARSSRASASPSRRPTKRARSCR